MGTATSLILCSHSGFEANVGKTMAELEDEGHPQEGGLFEGQRPPVAELATAFDGRGGDDHGDPPPTSAKATRGGGYVVLAE
jgi:hypothetical protein